MKVEAMQLLADVEFLKKNVAGVRFILGNDRWFTSFPTIAQWTEGSIVLEVKRTSGNFATEVAGIKSCLAHYGIEGKIVSVGGAVENAVQFTAKSGDEIIFILHKAIAEQKQQAKLAQLEHERASVNQEVNALLTVLSHARAGMFHRGVNAVFNQAEAVANVMKIHQQNQR